MSAWIPVVGWTLIHFVWQGIVLAVATAIVLGACRQRSANTRYLVACVGLVLMVVAPVVTAGVLWSATGQLPAAVVATPLAAPETAAAARVSGADDHVFVSAHPWDPANTVLPSMVFIWLGGVLLLTTRLAGGLWRVRHLRLRSMAQAASSWQAVADRVATRLGLRAVVRVVESRLVDTPTVVGWLRPVILLPIAAVTNLSPAQVEAVLAHELAHVRRHDYIVNVVQALAETLLFYHPAVWWVSRRIRTEREHCCDDLAVAVCEDRVTYAMALAALETARDRGTRLALAATQGPLVDRIHRVLQLPTGHESRSLSWAVSLGVTLVVVLGVSGVLPSPISGGDAQRLIASAQQTEPIASPDTFDWQFETTEHFGLYYYPALAPELERVGAEAERAYTRVSEVLTHQLAFQVPLFLFKTRDDFDQQDVVSEIPEGVTSFSEPARDRIFILLDEDPAQWYGQITHELTHVFAFDLIPRSGSTRTVPVWMDEGLAEYVVGVWNDDDLAQMRERVAADDVPTLSTANVPPPRLVYAMGHAAFDFIESEYGGNWIKKVLLAQRRYILLGEDPYDAAFQLTPDAFDQAFQAYVRWRFGALRQRQAQYQTSPLIGTWAVTQPTQVRQLFVAAALRIAFDGDAVTINRAAVSDLEKTATHPRGGYRSRGGVGRYYTAGEENPRGPAGVATWRGAHILQIADEVDGPVLRTYEISPDGQTLAVITSSRDVSGADTESLVTMSRSACTTDVHSCALNIWRSTR